MSTLLHHTRPRPRLRQVVGARPRGHSREEGPVTEDLQHAVGVVLVEHAFHFIEGAAPDSLEIARRGGCAERAHREGRSRGRSPTARQSEKRDTGHGHQPWAKETKPDDSHGLLSSPHRAILSTLTYRGCKRHAHAWPCGRTEQGSRVGRSFFVGEKGREKCVRQGNDRTYMVRKSP